MTDVYNLETAFVGPDYVRRNALQAARYAGNAAAMAANLQIAGCPDRVKAWELEQEVWLRRQDEAIAEAPVGKSRLAHYASETMAASFNALIVRH